jgi:H+/Cl- antiporter ClcA
VKGPGVRESGSPEVRACLALIGLCVAAAIAYGVAHDLVTTRVCLEYFTVGHPDWFGTEDPLLLALGWGVAATWYVGLVLAIPLVCAARFGIAPPWGARQVLPSLLILLAVTGGCAAIAGLAGWVIARSRELSLPGALGDLVPRERHAHFIAAWCAHGASYAVGFIGGLVLPVVIWRRRAPGLPDSRTPGPSP